MGEIQKENCKTKANKCLIKCLPDLTAYLRINSGFMNFNSTPTSASVCWYSAVQNWKLPGCHIYHGLWMHFEMFGCKGCNGGERVSYSEGRVALLGFKITLCRAHKCSYWCCSHCLPSNGVENSSILLIVVFVSTWKEGSMAFGWLGFPAKTGRVLVTQADSQSFNSVPPPSIALQILTLGRCLDSLGFSYLSIRWRW